MKRRTKGKKKVRIPKSWKLPDDFRIGDIRFRIAGPAELQGEGLPQDRADGVYFIKEPVGGPTTPADRSFYFVPVNEDSGGAFLGAALSEMYDLYTRWRERWEQIEMQVDEIRQMDRLRDLNMK